MDFSRGVFQESVETAYPVLVHFLSVALRARGGGGNSGAAFPNMVK